MSLEQPSRIESEEALKILNAIKDNPNVTQRELSTMSGISLGKVNFLLKSLIDRGWVKVDNFKKSNNKNAYLYFLTPHGIEEKARTTVLFLKRKMHEYERLEREIRALKEEVSNDAVKANAAEGVDLR
ncbi:MAG: MarR family EPS-associated transcriptional regulator [Syntrophales bacterium]|nr:MarR family EPS-associated transcriptional regulator [Syntrophales bacterium]